MRTLYHTWLCPFSRKIRLMMAEKKLDFDLVYEKLWEYRPEFTAMNPEGKVPVLVEIDGHVIAHHFPIAEYLEEKYTSYPLLGKTPVIRAEVRRLTAWFDEKFYQEVTHKLVFEKTMKKAMGLGFPDSTAIRQGHAHIHDHLEYIGWLVDRRNWLGGDDLSLADLTAAAHLSCVDYLGDVPWDKHERAKEWYGRLKSRPTFRGLLSDSVPGLSMASHYMNLDF